ncbi:hypothetical protein CCMA1212_008494 [Trichoderma ghanense]|uniref:Uncharacterized protein n=1 Tax=Trichoderma ghanense TaxID=65468 RepID=A0ABY2GW74_9HYPO
MDTRRKRFPDAYFFLKCFSLIKASWKAIQNNRPATVDVRPENIKEQLGRQELSTLDISDHCLVRSRDRNDVS